MSRLMRRPDTGTVVTVHTHAITRNMWEYFLLEPKTDSAGNILALVMGFETEMGDVNVKEIADSVLSFTKDMRDVMPCEGWEWVE